MFCAKDQIMLLIMVFGKGYKVREIFLSINNSIPQIRIYKNRG